MKLSIIIVSYNAPKHLEICLDSCREALKNVVDGEVIVVDNNSSEIDFEVLQECFPEVQFLLQKENHGFAKANNIGVEKALGEYILILNPDTIVPENLFDSLITFHQSKERTGFIGVRLIDTNGNFHPESKRNIPTAENSFSKLFSRFNDSKRDNYYKLEVGEFETAPCEILVGAFMFTTRKIYWEIGGFDSRYFMYGEDIDLSFSTELAGYKNYYKGDITVLHYKGESTVRDKKYFKIFFEAMMIFLSKYYQKNWLNYQLLRLGIFIKYLIEILKFSVNKSNLKFEKKVESNDFYWINHSSELQFSTKKHIVLDASKFSYQEILSIISNYNSNSRSFYIRPKNKNYVIGDDKKVVEIE
ncbi:glycosyltransferase family 2 protein [Empedobacter brevis]|uniref:glycosyltransferase family 2 protein n=1 Tax=Empedobacter brevis TaxID=247 RepID=UPI002FDF61AB